MQRREQKTGDNDGTGAESDNNSLLDFPHFRSQSIDVGLGRDILVDRVVNFGRDVFGNVACHTGALKRARQGQSIGHFIRRLGGRARGWRWLRAGAG